MSKVYRSIRLLFLIGICLAATSQLFVFPPASLAQQENSSVALQVLALINQWRLEQGLWPLKVNETLETMALAQASYLLPRLATIQNEADYHLDGQGHTPPQRAALAPYNWPYYGNPSRIEVGENAGIGTPQFVMNFWKGSDIHKRAALSSVYREVGIAALPYQTGYLFIVDFGARPGVLTALVSAAGDTLYTSDERSPYAGLQSANTQVRVFDALGRPLTDTKTWTPTLVLPEKPDGNIVVLYTNGSFQAVSIVNPASDIAVLPGDQTALKIATPTPTVMPPSSAPSATPTTASLILIYDQHSLTIYNNAGTLVDLSGFSVGGETGKVSIESWGRVAAVPFSKFPAQQCLQVQIVSDPVGAPPGMCKAVRSQVSLVAANVFWIKGSFTVKQGTQVIATCQADAGRCEVNWPHSGN